MKSFKLSIKHILYLILFAGLIALLTKVDLAEILYYLSLVDIEYLLVAAFCQILTMILLALQWSGMVYMAGFKPCFIQAFLMNAAGNVGDAASPGVKVGGELLRYFELKKRFDMDAEDGVLVVAFQKIISVSSFFALTLISLTYIITSVGGKGELIMSLIVTALIFALIIFLSLFIFLLPGKLGKFISALKIKEEKKGRILQFIEKYRLTLDHFKSDKTNVLAQFALALFIWAFYAVKLQIVLMAFDIRISIFMTGAATYISYMIGMIPLLPGGLGSFEAGMLALLGLAGVEMSLALSITIIFRIVTFWFEFLFCAVALIIERALKRWKRCTN